MYAQIFFSVFPTNGTPQEAKEVPVYSPAKILPQIVAQDKETNSVLI